MANQKPLNFIFFQPDEMRAESLGCYGHPLIKTPNLVAGKLFRDSTLEEHRLWDKH